MEQGGCCVLEPVGVDRAVQADIDLHHVGLLSGVGVGVGEGVEQQSVLEWGERQDVGEALVVLEAVDLLLG
ncbi:hypothetical protein VIMS_05369 [Mycobacterium marinum]|nr:hypothetical protein VIMS_05369 [Mycobacterium marinum]